MISNVRVRRVVVQPARCRLLISFILLLHITIGHAAHVFDAYRLVQFDKNGQRFGSRRTVVNHMATVLKGGETVPSENETQELEDRRLREMEDEVAKAQQAESKAKEEAEDEDDDDEDIFGDLIDEDEEDSEQPPAAREKVASEPLQKSKKPAKRSSDKLDSDLARSIVVISINSLTSAKLAEITDKRGASGVLILLESDEANVTQAQVDNWKKLERFMISRSFDIPIYFTLRDSKIDEMFEALQTHSTLKESVVDRYQLVVSGPEAAQLPTVTVNNFQAFHRGAPSVNTDSDSLPTIAIVANYDTFGAAPGLSFGVDHNGSGAVALLEIARIFSRLYSDFRTHGPYNILFVLTGAGRMNFAGAKHWLRTVDSRVLESLEFALCLEAIGSPSDKLYLHVSKSPKTPEIRSVYATFEATARLMDIPFEIVHKKINISSPFVNWQHEHFSRKRILAGTLSTKAHPSPVFSAASIFDRRNSVNSDLLRRNIKFISEVLAKHIYGFSGKELEVAKDSLGVNQHFVDSWLDFLSTQPRQAQYAAENSELMSHLERVLAQHTGESKKSSFFLDAGFRFYRGSSEQMSAYKVKPFTFDVFLALCIVAYLLCFHLYFSAPSSWAELFALCNRGADKKKRA